MTDNFKNTWETYTASWKAETEEEKRVLFEQSLSTACVYTDPITQTNGWDELCAYMLDFHKQIPGGHFVTTYFLKHHDKSISKWEMRGGDNSVIGDGVSYGEYDEDHRLVAMTGFFETP